MNNQVFFGGYELPRLYPGDDVVGHLRTRVRDAVCFVYTCRRLIDLSNDCIYVPALDRSLG